MRCWLVLLGLSLACRGDGLTAPSGSERQNPFAEHALAPAERGWVEGAVEETLRAGSYVYLRVRTSATASLWVASLAATTPSPAPDRVRVLVLGRAEQFHSRRLARDFSPLAFGAVRALRSPND